jgi:energy-coupling factor transporter ATP-binding protein EcfA2
MFEAYQICPYTGLRSFTEDESLYFKGREDDIDQATSQLQKNKFLMLTGASGDGKSSLIYAGIIPNARSGFLKSKYSQWCVADFRPERTPFQNLCRSLARQFEIADANTVASELQHGFSALVDLYRNSKRFADTQSVAWQLADDKGKAALRREAANLIILVDQFEEFFTNTENYQHGVPSRESNLVLNLLLETARIALDEDLPIYVVFTMRSDYIGQCAAFRGLPEYLGFSQFFVPRLNRVQLQQVIEEPAKLSGNRISRRLTERLIHDITEGVDQLPILQHALNQIWVAADRGNEEMDLLHYAMVGGMHVDELPDEQAPRFREWFSTLPPEIKACYHEPNLQNVLDTHTNKLYEQASRYYAENTGKQISDDDAKQIIRTAFTCLTKIDQSRAVRNRMTLHEITNILNHPSYDSQAICGVLNIFREPGNTFIHPFIKEDEPESSNVEDDQVLDITHESLIRNWNYLGQWAREENESRSVSLDFEQQLGRWVNSGKSNNFLLSIGPLTYFEGWFNRVKPNAYWIARYLPEETSQEEKLKKSKEILGNAQEFIGRSADKHIITRTIMRYGPKRIAAVLGVVALITLSSFAVRNYFSKQNESVLKSMKAQAMQLAADPKVILANRTDLVCEELKMGLTTPQEVIGGIKDSIQKINIANAAASLLIFQGRGRPEKEILELLSIADSIMGAYHVPINDPGILSSFLKEMNDLRVTLEFGNFYNPNPKIDELKKRNVSRMATLVQQIVEKQPAGFSNMNEFTISLEHVINNKGYNGDEIKGLLAILSPFENLSPSPWLRTNFMQDKLLQRGEQDYGFLHNGLYQQLAYLYAAAGNSEKALQCMDTLLTYSQSNFEGDYNAGGDNATNIAAVFYSNGTTDKLDEFVQGYCVRKKVNEEHFYGSLLARSMTDRATASSLDLYFWMNVKVNLNLRFSSNDQLKFFYEKYRQRVDATIADTDQKNFLMAHSYKQEGISRAVRHPDSSKTSSGAIECFDLAIAWYNKVDPASLEQQERILGVSLNDEALGAKKTLFIYPDYRPRYLTLEPRNFFHYYVSDEFLEYIIDNNLFDKFYPGVDELELLSSWLNDYNVKMFFPRGFMVKKARYEVLQKLAAELDRRKADQAQDFNLLYLHLGLEAQEKGDKEKMLLYYRKLQPEKFLNILQVKEYGNNVNDLSLRLIALAVKGLTEAGQFDEAYKLMAIFKKPNNRSSIYSFAASEMIIGEGDSKLVQQFIDSAKQEMQRRLEAPGGQAYREKLAFALSMQDPGGSLTEIRTLIKNLPQKLFANMRISRAFAFHDQLYRANEVKPALISDNDLAELQWNILYGYNSKREVSPGWKTYHESYRPFFIRSINYQDESN